MNEPQLLPTHKSHKSPSSTQDRFSFASQPLQPPNLAMISSISPFNSHQPSQFLHHHHQIKQDFAAESQLQFSNTQNSQSILNTFEFGEIHDESQNSINQDEDMFGLGLEIDFDISYGNTDTQIPMLRQVNLTTLNTNTQPSFTQQPAANSSIVESQPLIHTTTPSTNLMSPQSTFNLPTLHHPLINSNSTQTRQQQSLSIHPHPSQQQFNLSHQSQLKQQVDIPYKTEPNDYFNTDEHVYGIGHDGPLENDFGHFDDDSNGDNSSINNLEIQQQMYGLSLQFPSTMSTLHHNQQRSRQQYTGSNTDFLLIDIDDDDDDWVGD
jgi:hypothetical protein